MFSTITAIVQRREEGATDRFNNETSTLAEPERVGGVLVDAPTTEDMEAARINGYSASLVLHWPTSQAYRLRGAEITLPEPWGGPFRVVGNPMPLMPENNPLPWTRIVVEDSRG